MSSLINGLTGAAADLSLAVGLVIAAGAIVFLTKIGMLPKKSIPYVVLAVGGAFGLAWFKNRQARALRPKLEAERHRLQEMETRAANLGTQLDASNARLDAARAAFEARRTAISESIVDLDAEHEKRLQSIAGLSGKPLDDEMTALLARLDEEH